ncbi:hypothetical protein GCM10007907_20770 [Chitinimonas prasina]|uniref:Transcription regulator BetR N-terminal domain-containing protein n=1 Tax=Chitinimonas prasina TaxID=1434937 RepID=A0ABQ5YI04_9NEIS|nr:helix-turn-helix domain-containing protein [Chitinimonas prasina]GLR13287.1 hypothetical protein GCM10007907_20770 [Chitinimonas prasina]
MDLLEELCGVASDVSKHNVFERHCIAFSEQLAPLPDPAAIYARVVSLLHSEESDPASQARKLATKLQVHRSKVYRWRDEGIRSVTDVMAICEAFDVPPAVLLEPTLEGTQMVDCVMSFEGCEYICRAWVSKLPQPADKPFGLVCRPSKGRYWRLEACNRGPRATAHVAYYVDMQCTQRYSTARIAICLPGMQDYAASLAQHLGGYMGQLGHVHAYADSAALFKSLSGQPARAVAREFELLMGELQRCPTREAYESAHALWDQLKFWGGPIDDGVVDRFALPPNLLVVHEALPDWPSFVLGVRGVTGQYIPALVLCETPAEPQLIEGYYFCSIMLPDVLTMARRLV